MSNAVTDEYVLEALSRYGDAIEGSVIATVVRSEDAEPAGGAPYMDRELTVEIPGVVESESEGRRRVLVLAGAFLVAAVAVIGAVFAIGGNTTGVDTSPADSPSGTGEISDGSIFGPTIIGFGEQGTTVFSDGEFVSLGRDSTGLIVARSTDGTNWTTTPVTNAPDGATPRELSQTNDGWVVVFEVWPEADRVTNQFFSNGNQPERLLGTSADLLQWDTVPLPAFTVLAGSDTFVQGVAVSDTTVAILGAILISDANEREILLSSGAATEVELENYCGTYEFLDGDFVAYSCAIEGQMFDEIDEDSPVDPSELTDLTEFELLRIGPGEAGFDQLVELEGFGRGGFGEVSVVLAGPFDGPFEQTELDVGDFNVFIAGSADGFAAVGTSLSDRTELATSTDGVEWSEPQLVRGGLLLQGLDVSQAGVTVIGQMTIQPGIGLLVSEDLEQPWSESVVPTSLDFFGTAVGPSGVAVLAAGQPLGEIEVEKDGFTMVVEQASFDAGLRGPDGEVIFEVGAAHVLGFGSQDPAGVVRFEGELGEADIVWLDPATGEDLVRFTLEEFAEAQGSTLPAFETEIWFSSDGENWALLQNSERNSTPSSMMVGDDGVLLRSSNNPPADLFAFQAEDRMPTSTEVAALEAWYEDDAVTWEWIAAE